MTFVVKILGSNSAVPAFDRNHTSQIVQVNNKYILIDCGEGTQLQMAKYKVKYSKIDYILISHLHGDHYLGLMGLLFTFHLYGRTKPLTVYGPKGLDEIILTQLKHSQSILNYKIDFIQTDPNQPQLIFENQSFTIKSFPLKHRIPCTGFLIKEKQKKRRIDSDKIPEGFTNEQLALIKKGEDIIDESGRIVIKNKDITKPPKKSRSYAYCSDTKYDEDIIPFIKQVDLLYHESTFMKDLEERAQLTFHSTAQQAATIAKKAKVKKLLLGHFSSRYRQLEPLLNEAKSVFSETELAIEGQKFEINC